jgi:murein DD-endopeptidase MepM/ murein hydrolase activator NlpD
LTPSVSEITGIKWCVIRVFLDADCGAWFILETSFQHDFKCDYLDTFFMTVVSMQQSIDLDSLLINKIIASGQVVLNTASQWLAEHPKRITALVAAIMIGGGGGAFAVATLAPDAADLPVHEVMDAVKPLILANSNLDAAPAFVLYRTDTTRASDTADTLLKRLGVDDVEAAAYLRNDSAARQILMGRSGRQVTVEALEDQRLKRFTARWSTDTDGQFKRMVIERGSKGFSSRLETAALTASTQLASGTIQSSLFAATDEAKIPDAVATQVAEIFSGDIDFHRALRKGDRFSVVYETLEADGEPIRAGRVLSAEFVNKGKTYQAMWFAEPASASVKASVQAGAPSGKGGYYTFDGQSLRRAFLASPMAFSRVTSGFKMRLHPILQTMRAHLGIDYGAPTGTPVRSIGDGVVEFAGSQNGFGNVIFIKHNGKNTTVYAHLSRIDVRKGQSVSQSQNIGAVGSTGWATGPHLHFEFRVNGHHIDPLTMARQSETVPVTAAAKPVFDRYAAQARMALMAAGSMQSASAQ